MSTTVVPAIPADLGFGGAYLEQGGSGEPNLKTILVAMQTAISELQRNPSNADPGPNLTDSNQTILHQDGSLRRIPAIPLTANRTVTLGVTDSTNPLQDGDQIQIQRLDTSAFTVAFVNGGVAGGTLYTMPASKVASATFEWQVVAGVGNWNLVQVGVG